MPSGDAHYDKWSQASWVSFYWQYTVIPPVHWHVSLSCSPVLSTAADETSSSRPPSRSPAKTRHIGCVWRSVPAACLRVAGLPLASAWHTAAVAVHSLHTAAAASPPLHCRCKPAACYLLPAARCRPLPTTRRRPLLLPARCDLLLLLAKFKSYCVQSRWEEAHTCTRSPSGTLARTRIDSPRAHTDSNRQ